ncbi:MAG: hypothetical protein HYT80_10860, partial [Euryarchaeota archaeon]|nr:hypothetical protein [Euryarchaeota archaeon]
LVDRGLAATGSAPLEARLRAIARHAPGWRWISGVFVVAFTVTAVGLALLTHHQDSMGAGEWSFAGLVLYVVALAVLVVTMTLNATVVLAGAQRVDGGGPVPPDVRAAWDGAEALVSWFMVLAFSSMFLFGIEFLLHGPGPAWIGWFSIVLGGGLVVSYPLKFLMEFWVADLPLWVHVWGIGVGIGLLQANG